MKIYILAIVLTIFFSCKGIDIKDEDTRGNILFKKMVESSKKVDNILINGSVKVSGSNEIPSTFIKFESGGSVRQNIYYFKLFFINTPLMDLYFDKGFITLINHRDKEVVKFEVENIDFSNVIGVNFNPKEVSYALLGKIPYSDNLQLMEFSWTKTNYFIKATSASSEYEVYLNENEDIVNMMINNQFYDIITLNKIKYRENDDGESIPQIVELVADERDLSLNFIISSIVYPDEHVVIGEIVIPEDYEKIDSIEVEK